MTNSGHHSRPIASGQHATRLDRSTSWRAFDFVASDEDISGGVEWSIHDEQHAVIVHLGGGMNALETELDGEGKSFGPANCGEIWIIPAGARYASRAQGATINYGVLYLKSRVMKRLLDGEDFSYIAPLHGTRDEFCFNAVQKLVECSTGNDDMAQMFGESISETLCMHLFRAYGSEYRAALHPTKSVGFNKRIIRDLQEYIHENMAEHIALDDIARLTGLSTHNFLIAFRQSFGVTPAQFIIQQRLRRVQWLLSNSTMEITEIAYDAGFSSHSHLSTTFKKHLNCTPSEFRARWRS